MNPDQIRSTTRFETAGLNKLDAVDSAQAFWLREIAAQLAEIAVYAQHLMVSMGNINAQLDAIRVIEHNKSKAKSPVAAGGKRGGD